jgi:hypothetical protein
MGGWVYVCMYVFVQRHLAAKRSEIHKPLAWTGIGKT